jgi:hypothetical protein
VPDWAGGTRIGETLRVFNRRWSRRVHLSGSVVLIISDGWDRGEPSELRAEMEWLQRSSRRVVWLNPLLGAEDYRPLTRGMQAALPFADDFLPVHNLASLEQLAEKLGSLDAHRPRRYQRPSTIATVEDHGTGSRSDPAPGHVLANPTFRHPLWGSKKTNGP